jgi:hypothetical protein
LQFNLRRLRSPGWLMVALGIALVIESRVISHGRYGTRGIDPFLLAENPRVGIERYLGIALLLVGFWLVSQSKGNPEDDGEDRG